jgi:hypothetical protein
MARKLNSKIVPFRKKRQADDIHSIWCDGMLTPQHMDTKRQGVDASTGWRERGWYARSVPL